MLTSSNTGLTAVYCVPRPKRYHHLMRSGSVMELRHLDLDVSAEDLEAGARTVLATVRPQWPHHRVAFKVFTDGITNKLIGCSLDKNTNDVVLVRVYGENTNMLIDREAETNNFKVLHKAGYAPRLYATFNNGIAYEFVPGEVLTPTTVKCPTVYPNVARMMAKFHHIDLGPSVPKNPVIWEKLRHYLSLIPETYSSLDMNKKFEEYFPGGIKSLEREVSFMENKLSALKSQVVFCHNDLLLANIIYDKGNVTFIDYEYAAYNHQAFDIGNHFAEFAGVSDVDYSRYPNREFQLLWLEVYLEEFRLCSNNPTPIEKSEIDELFVQVNKFSLASHLLWAIWALVQAHHSKIDFDFLKYGGMRMKEYYTKKGTFLNNISSSYTNSCDHDVL